MYCVTAVKDITLQTTILSYTNSGTDALLCQILVHLGNGSDDLDGTGGEFELTLMFGSETNMPDPQLITFSTATRASVFTEQFPLAIGETVTAKIKSPNAADTSVYVHACIFEVGVESIRDEINDILSLLYSATLNQRMTKNIFDTSSGGGGVYPLTTDSGTGVYPWKH